MSKDGQLQTKGTYNMGKWRRDAGPLPRACFPHTTLDCGSHISRKIRRAALLGDLLSVVSTSTLTAQASHVAAQTPGAALDAFPTEGGYVTEASSGSLWSALAGERAERRRFIVGILAMHPYNPKFPEVEWTRGFSVAFSQWFAATFVNSYDERSFIAGIERDWLRGSWGVSDFGAGYRVGLVTGYDERLVAWAEDVPVLAFGGLVGWFEAGPFGLDVYYVYRAITLETSVRF